MFCSTAALTWTVASEIQPQNSAKNCGIGVV